MSEVLYEPVNEPPDPDEAFTRDDSAGLQAQAALLLAVAWQLSGDGFEDGDDEMLGYTGLAPVSPSLRATRVAPDDVDQFIFRAQSFGRDELRQQLFLTYRAEPDP